MGKNSRGNLAEIARRHYDESLRNEEKCKEKSVEFQIENGIIYREICR